MLRRNRFGSGGPGKEDAGEAQVVAVQPLKPRGQYHVVSTKAPRQASPGRSCIRQEGPPRAPRVPRDACASMEIKERVQTHLGGENQQRLTESYK